MLHTLRHENELRSLIIIEGVMEGTRSISRSRTNYISQIMIDAWKQLSNF